MDRDNFTVEEILWGFLNSKDGKMDRVEIIQEGILLKDGRLVRKGAVKFSTEPVPIITTAPDYKLLGSVSNVRREGDVVCGDASIPCGQVGGYFQQVTSFEEAGIVIIESMLLRSVTVDKPVVVLKEHPE